MKRIPRELILGLTKPDVEQFPIVEGMTCIEVKLPDDLNYVYLLQGFVAQMTNYWAYKGEIEARKAVALLMQAAYDATDWDGCMDCSGVLDCIENDDDVRNAIQQIVNQGSTFPPDYPYTQNLPPSRKTQDLSTAYNPTCDLSRLFGQCYGIVDLIHDSIIDVNQKLELSGNAIELAQNTVGTIPVVAGVSKLIGIEGALGLINYFQEVVAEGFDGQYTTTPGGTRDEIACAIFCACQEDCVITIERVTEVLEERLAVYVAPPSLEGFVNLVETLAGVAVDTTYVVDMAFYSAIGLMNTGNYIYGGKFTGPVFDLVISLKADEPNNDWELLCPCSPVCREEYTFDEQLPDTVMSVGTLDTDGYIDSGILDVGGGDTAWVVFDFELPVVNTVRWRWVLDRGGLYYGQLYSATITHEAIDVEAVERDDGLWEVTIPIDPAETDTWTINNFRAAPIGNTEPFKILRIEVVREC